MNQNKITEQKPRLSKNGLEPVHYCEVSDHLGQVKQHAIPGETPLTIKVDNREIITLMTLGTNPEELTLGYLRNQHLMENLDDIESVEVDWERQTSFVTTNHGKGILDLEEKLSRVTVSSSCGQGTLFSCTVDKLYDHKLPEVTLLQSTIYQVLSMVKPLNKVYRKSGSVHGCCLCEENRVIMCVEDVGRHNAADSIAGRMWLDDINGEDKILFTTGRITSEMLMKAAFMSIPVVISRSGVTQMGLELAYDIGMVVIGRAKMNKFLVFNGKDQIVYDAIPETA